MNEADEGRPPSPVDRRELSIFFRQLSRFEIRLSVPNGLLRTIRTSVILNRMRSPSKAQERKQRLEAALPELVSRLRLPGVRRIVLFGSLARGNVGKRSDIDLIIERDDTRRFLDRLSEVYERIADLGLPVDALVYTREELQELAESRPFIRRALEEGRVLYEG